MTTIRRAAICGAIALLAAPFAVGMWRTSADPLARTPTALAATFDSDIRNLVYRWNPDDRRPPAERHEPPA